MLAGLVVADDRSDMLQFTAAAAAAAATDRRPWGDSSQRAWRNCRTAPAGSRSLPACVRVWLSARAALWLTSSASVSAPKKTRLVLQRAIDTLLLEQGCAPSATSIDVFWLLQRVNHLEIALDSSMNSCDHFTRPTVRSPRKLTSLFVTHRQYSPSIKLICCFCRRMLLLRNEVRTFICLDRLTLEFKLSTFADKITDDQPIVNLTRDSITAWKRVL